MENETKRSAATGMARRSFWIALVGGACGGICRIDLLGPAVQGVLSLIATTLLLIAAGIGVFALIRIKAADRQAALMPALGGLVLGLTLLANLSYWSRDRWVQARMRKIQAENNSSTAPAAPTSPASTRHTERTLPKSTMKYELPALEQIPEAAAGLRSQATRAQGDDAAVLRAWAAHLEKTYAAYTNTWAASNKLHEIDLLDPKLVSNFVQDEVVRRRGLANQYADAWRKLSENLSVLSGAYGDSLRAQQVSSERAAAESQSFFEFVQQSDTAARLAGWQKLCKAEKDVGRHYNYAVGAVFEYALLASRVKTPNSSVQTQMEQQVAKLRDAERAATDVRGEVAASLRSP